MAGNYPDVPGYRMALDRDGTAGVHLNYISGSIITSLSSTILSRLNDESSVNGFTVIGGDDGTKGVALVFPELRDLVGYHIDAAHGGSLGNAEWSANTTNGLDGTWTSLGTTVINTFSLVSQRSTIKAIVASGARGIRWRFSSGAGQAGGVIYSIHVYGSLTVGQNPDRLRLWHPTLDQEVGPAYFDWGDIRQASSADRTFRLKNNSVTLTANAVAVTTTALTDTSPSVPAQHLLSLDGVNFAASVNVSTIAPGGFSGVITLRRVNPSSAVLGLWWARIVAAAGSWA